MWQEAKKQEKILRGIMVDYKQRAERRKGYYEKIKKDPAEFLQLWGRKSKIHIDPFIAQAADNPSIMTKWNGDENTLIDRFDVRSHLDYLSEYKDTEKKQTVSNESLENEERMLNYERYRTLVQNEAVGITEMQCLKQIEIDEKYDSGLTQNYQIKEEKKDFKAQIGYIYHDSTDESNNNNISNNLCLSGSKKITEKASKMVESVKEDEDLDLALDINKLTAEHKVILNKCATNFGMEYGDYIRMLILDDEEKEKIKMNKLLEAEKAQYSGRKSRRERRIVKERLRREKGDISPLSYVIAKSPEKRSSGSESKSSSRSSSRSRYKRKTRFRSRSPSKYENEYKNNQIIMITSFGGEDDEEESGSNRNISKSNLSESKKAEIEEKLSNLKRLKKNVSNLRSSHSRSQSKSPVQNKTETNNKTNIVVFKKRNNYQNDENLIKATNTDIINSDSSSQSTDEEKELKKYLERRHYRKKHLNSESTKHDLVKPLEKNMSELASPTYIEEDNERNSNIKFNDIKASTSTNNTSHDIGSLSNKFRTTEEFKQYKEKLKKKIQKQIDKQLKKDKVVEKSKRKKEREERREREAELNYLSEKMRQRIKMERKKNENVSSDYSDQSHSHERSRSRNKRIRSRSRSRERSKFRKNDQNRSRRRSKSRSFKTTRHCSRSRTKSPRNRFSSKKSSSRSNSRTRSKSRSRQRGSFARAKGFKKDLRSIRSRSRSVSIERNYSSESKLFNSRKTKRSTSKSPKLERRNLKNSRSSSISSSSSSNGSSFPIIAHSRSYSSSSSSSN